MSRTRSLRQVWWLLLVAGCASGSTDSTSPGNDTGAGTGGATTGSSQGGGGASSAGGNGGSSTSTGGNGGSSTSTGGNGGSSTSTGGSGGSGGSSTSTSGSGGGTATDPCAGVTCNSPPADICQGTASLLVHDPVGTCLNGDCTYAASSVACANGCSADACQGNPCQDVTCATPPANECGADNQTLRVYSASGKCNNGLCQYASQVIPCANGCSNNECVDDLCQNVTCSAPPTNECASAEYLTSYSASGTCSNGQCSYDASQVYCAFGCASGLCNGDPCNGKSCVTPPKNECADASTLRKFTTPGTCNGGNCTYESTEVSCPGGCAGGACTPCGSDASCGSACSPCGGATPRCFNASQCVQCLGDGDCAPGDTCELATHTCRTPSVCALPADACSNGSQDRYGCSNARVIGRAAAAVATGFTISDNTCDSLNFGKFKEGGTCYSAAGDHAYRVFARAGESLSATVLATSPCGGNDSVWHPTVMIWKGAECGPNACTTRLACQASGGTSATQSHAVVEDGWYTVVVDGRYNWQASEPDEGTYTLTVKLTTAKSECP